MPVSLARTSQTRRPKSAWVLMPVPTAVPPIGQLQQRLHRRGGPAHRTLQLPGQPADLLPERKRRGVGQMRSPDLENVFPLGGLRGQHFAASLQGGNQSLADRHGGGDVDGGRKHVVRALAQVDVVVRMDRGKWDGPICAKHRAPTEAGRAVPANWTCPLCPANSIARLAITSLAFMLLDVPEPV